ncbi:MAG: hypothetical protein WD673_11165 [Alphaproteobacteria bacterium]
MRHRLIARAAVLGLVLAHLGPASAQESTTGNEESGGAVAEEGSVVEGGPGGLDIGRGTVWLGVGALVAIGLALSIASSDSGTSGTTGTNGTGGTSGSN